VYFQPEAVLQKRPEHQAQLIEIRFWIVGFTIDVVSIRIDPTRPSGNSESLKSICGPDQTLERHVPVDGPSGANSARSAAIHMVRFDRVDSESRSRRRFGL
jgi:hypothetical protein